MHNVEDTVGRLTLLKALGVRLAIDDFGTGYSSLAYLRQFPIDILKIDRSFVSGIADTSEAVALVHAMVQLGKALGLETVAEGVENDGQRVQLAAENVDTAQGFFRPPTRSRGSEPSLGGICPQSCGPGDLALISGLHDLRDQPRRTGPPGCLGPATRRTCVSSNPRDLEAERMGAVSLDELHVPDGFEVFESSPFLSVVGPLWVRRRQHVPPTFGMRIEERHTNTAGMRTVPCWWPWRIWLSVTAFVPSLVAVFVSSPPGSQWTSRDPSRWATGWKLRPIFSTNRGGTCSRTATWSVTANGSFEPAVSIRSWTIESLAIHCGLDARAEEPRDRPVRRRGSQRWQSGPFLRSMAGRSRQWGTRVVAGNGLTPRPVGRLAGRSL